MRVCEMLSRCECRQRERQGKHAQWRLSQTGSLDTKQCSRANGKPEYVFSTCNDGDQAEARLFSLEISSSDASRWCKDGAPNGFKQRHHQ